VIREAKGIIVYASQRAGASFMGGSGGSGLIVAKLPNGEWSAPSAIMPGNITGGLMFGFGPFSSLCLSGPNEVDDYSLQTFSKR
jgi:lipid-binding SYLF domain-containing protein